MATSILPSLCPICKEPIQGGQRVRVIGLDQRQPGAPPANITAHAYCFTGCVIVRPGQTLEQAIAASRTPVQVDLFSHDNALLAVGV